MIRCGSLPAIASVAAWAFLSNACDAASALTDEEIRTAAIGEEFSLPTPGEMIAAFDKAARPDWSSSFRKLPSGAFTSRPQIAINLGALLADGHLAVQAQDRQELKNVFREIKNLAKSLGLEKDLVGRNNTIADFADGMQWNALSEELEAVQNEMATAMNGRQDRDLVSLMTLGAWLRALDVVSTGLAANYSPGGAKVLRQPVIGGYFVQRLAAMPAKIQASPMIVGLRRGLVEIQMVLSPSASPLPSGADATKLRTLTNGLLNAIVTHEK